MRDFTLPLHTYEKRWPNRYEALYQALRDGILSGRYGAGTKLPSTRELAALYRYSRGTVVLAYEMLWADGYLEGKHGSGSYVRQLALERGPKRDTTQTPLHLSAWIKRMGTNRAPFFRKGKGEINLDLGIPDLEHFPRAEWNRCMRRGTRDVAALITGNYVPAEGLPKLRAAIATLLREGRGLETSAEDIVVVSGSAEALALLAHVLLDRGKRVVLEDPSYAGMHRAVRAAGGTLLRAESDEKGIVVRNWPAAMAFVTPGHQYPTGITTRIERRLDLLAWAKKRAAWIIEDDFDCDFRRKGRPIEPLKVLDTDDRVIYVGTFSKTISTALRIGFVVLPWQLRVPFLTAKELFTPLASSLVEQAAVAEFIVRGGFRRHLRRMQKVYAAKHERFGTLLAEHLSDAFTWTDSEVGLHRFGWWNHSAAAFTRFEQLCQARRIVWESTRPNFLKGWKPSVMLGFSHLTPSEMSRAVEIMEKVYRERK